MAVIKTTVYLEEAEAAALRRMAARTGLSQAEIVRDAVAKATARDRGRRFKSLGAGRGTGERIDADAIVRREMGTRKLR